MRIGAWAMPRRIDRPAGLAEPFRRTVEEHHADLAILRHQLANLLFVVLHQCRDFLRRHARLPARDGLAVLMKKVKIVPFVFGLAVDLKFALEDAAHDRSREAFVGAIGLGQQLDIGGGITVWEAVAPRGSRLDDALLAPAGDQTGDLRFAESADLDEIAAHDSFVLFRQLHVLLGAQGALDQGINLLAAGAGEAEIAAGVEKLSHLGQCETFGMLHGDLHSPALCKHALGSLATANDVLWLRSKISSESAGRQVLTVLTILNRVRLTYLQAAQVETVSVAGRPRAAHIGEVALVRAAQQGDADAFEQLVRLHDRTVLRVALNILRSPEDARDAYQEVFLRAYRSLGKFRFQCSFRTWLYRIGTNVCLDQLRRQSVRKERTVGADEGAPGTGVLANAEDERPHSNPDRVLAGREAGRSIQQALEQLSPKERMVFELKHHEGLRLRAIGEALSISEEAAKNCLFRATRKLRAALGGTQA